MGYPFAIRRTRTTTATDRSAGLHEESAHIQRQRCVASRDDHSSWGSTDRELVGTYFPPHLQPSPGPDLPWGIHWARARRRDWDGFIRAFISGNSFLFRRPPPVIRLPRWLSFAGIHGRMRENVYMSR